MRTWANLGIAYSNSGKYSEAAGYFLCALSLNGSATHIWEYLHTAFSCMDRFDLVGKMQARNINDFKNEFDFITPESLPKPSTSKL